MDLEIVFVNKLGLFEYFYRSVIEHKLTIIRIKCGFLNVRNRLYKNMIVLDGRHHYFRIGHH